MLSIMCQERGAKLFLPGAQVRGDSGLRNRLHRPRHDQERGRGEPGGGEGATGEYLLVEIHDPKMGLLKFISLENYLSDLLGVKVDLVEKQTLKPTIGGHVTEEMESI